MRAGNLASVLAKLLRRNRRQAPPPLPHSNRRRHALGGEVCIPKYHRQRYAALSHFASITGHRA